MSKLFLFTGEVQSGRTGFMEELLQELGRRDLHAAGFLSIGEGREERSGFTLMDLSDGNCSRLAIRGRMPGWESQGPFDFDPETLEKGRKILDRALDEARPLIIVDEVGPMELEGRGWAASLDRLVLAEEGLQLWVTRNRVLEQVCRKWKIPPDRVLEMDRERMSEYLKYIEDYA